ncbi:MAG: DUF2721 domain-containing protein [Longimicrobiales bacterium]
MLRACHTEGPKVPCGQDSRRRCARGDRDNRRRPRDSATGDDLPPLHTELELLTRRARFINLAITFCTITALFICAVVATLFSAAFLEYQAPTLIAVLFVGGMTAFFVGLLCFLREIFIAAAGVGTGRPVPALELFCARVSRLGECASHAAASSQHRTWRDTH